MVKSLIRAMIERDKSLRFQNRTEENAYENTREKTRVFKIIDGQVKFMLTLFIRVSNILKRENVSLYCICQDVCTGGIGVK